MKMTTDEKKRLLSFLTKCGIVFAVGILYALMVRMTGWGIPCLFHTLTHLHCPGCGISRMFLSLMQGDFIAAARYNLLVLGLLPFALVLSLCKARQYVKTGTTTMSTIEKIFYIVAFVLCAVFFVLRNTNTLPFLTMP